MQCERLTAVIADHGEGAAWNPQDGLIYSLDMLAGVVLRTDPTTGATTRTQTPERVASLIRPTSEHGHVVAGENGIYLGSLDGTLVKLAEAPPRRGVRLNDGCCDPKGRLWIGELAADERDGRLYVVDRNGNIEVRLAGLAVSNGLAFSDDGGTAIYTDSATRRVDRMIVDPETGEVCSRDPFVLFEPDWGMPDGLAVDGDDGVWVACWGGAAVRHFDAAGRLDQVVSLPVRHPTSCAFVGTAMDRLVVTTSCHEIDPGEEGVAGSMFVLDVPVPGRLLHPFGASELRGPDGVEAVGGESAR